MRKVSVIPARLYWMKYFFKYKIKFFTTSSHMTTRTCATSIGKTARKGLSTGVAAVSSKTSSEKDICEAKEIGDVCKRASTYKALTLKATNIGRTCLVVRVTNLDVKICI